MITLTAPLKIWTNDEGRVHFLSVPEDISDDIRVEASIRDVTWRTSVFPVKSGGYFLPVKIAVCREAGIAAGDDVAVTLELL